MVSQSKIRIGNNMSLSKIRAQKSTTSASGISQTSIELKEK